MDTIIQWIQSNHLLLIGALVVYLILPDTNPIKQFLQKIIGGILPQPGPTPTPGPGPTPGPVGLDISSIIQQILLALITKSRASGNKELEDAAMKVATALQDEQARAASSPLAPALLAGIATKR